jgi:hypothetical protein
LDNLGNPPVAIRRPFLAVHHRFGRQPQRLQRSGIVAIFRPSKFAELIFAARAN